MSTPKRIQRQRTKGWRKHPGPTRRGMYLIPGGWHIKTLTNGKCVDVLQMLYNYRVVLSSSPDHMAYEHGWCYFGHGVSPTGQPRTMDTALTAAALAAWAWDGEGAPAGYDKQAC